MAATITGDVSPNNCGHRTLTVNLDGVSYTIQRQAGAMTAEEKAQFLEEKGISYQALLNRVIVGDEATNVKQYDFLGPGNAITKTNIGVNYVNVLPGLNGKRIPVDMTVGGGVPGVPESEYGREWTAASADRAGRGQHGLVREHEHQRGRRRAGTRYGMAERAGGVYGRGTAPVADVLGDGDGRSGVSPDGDVGPLDGAPVDHARVSVSSPSLDGGGCPVVRELPLGRQRREGGAGVCGDGGEGDSEDPLSDGDGDDGGHGGLPGGDGGHGGERGSDRDAAHHELQWLAGEALNLNLSGGVAVGGELAYVLVPV